jgi:hypothetical protein
LVCLPKGSFSVNIKTGDRTLLNPLPLDPTQIPSNV